MPKGSYEFLCCDNKNSIATESGKTNVKVRWQQTAMQCERRRKIGELLPKVERLTSKSGGSRQRCSASGEGWQQSQVAADDDAMRAAKEER